MCLLLESIKLKNGKLLNLNYHQKRVNYSFEELFPGLVKLDLSTIINIPENCLSGIYKVRVLYDENNHNIEFIPYTFRKIESLKIVFDDSVRYNLKFYDRSILKDLFAKRGTCDDILIVKNGLITDSFAANPVFFDGENWLTPAEPLLKGTKRQKLIDSNIIAEQKIKPDDLKLFSRVGLINAMIDFDEMPIIPIENIEL